jgi:hypothetical protein
MQRKTIRLACRECDRDDGDGITRSDLRKAIKQGWREVERVQTYRQACKTYDDSWDEPEGFSKLEWWTHLGLCPECAAIEDLGAQSPAVRAGSSPTAPPHDRGKGQGEP